jgi:glycosyltransferase involved in cell wall biosynthesis
MPLYNGERFLAEAIDSILGQTFTDFEFVIIDDGSTDTSPAILADYASRDPRIRVVTQAKAGIVAALNRGLAECRTALVARMDADDISLPTRLERQVSFLAAHPRVAVVGTAFRLISEDGRPGTIVAHPVNAATIRKGLSHATMLGHPTVMMRRDAVVNGGGYREALRHAEDYDLWTRLSDGHELTNLSECLLSYRTHRGQVSWSQAEAQAMATLAVRALSAQRRRFGKETVSLPKTMDRDFLLTLGVSTRDIEDALIARVTGRISDLTFAGMPDEAAAVRRELADTARQSGLRSFTRSMTARLAWSDFGLAWRDRRWLPALRALATCARSTAGDWRLLRAALDRLTSCA